MFLASKWLYTHKTSLVEPTASIVLIRPLGLDSMIFFGFVLSFFVMPSESAATEQLSPEEEWAKKAVEHAEVYMRLLRETDSRALKLTP